MKPIRLSVAALLLLSACGGNPFVDDTATGGGTDGGTTGGGTTDTGGITTEGGLPPGTVSPTAAKGITRSEPAGKDKLNGDSGNGFVKNVSYNAAADTFKVDNLGFDGNNVFARSTPVGNLGPYAVYEGKPSQPDSVTGTPISQFEHRAIYGVRNDADGKATVQFAIVRTGAYVDYGFGGFIYSRAGGVTLPKEGVGAGDSENPDYRGQAHFEGKVAGLRDFKSRGGLEYTTADMRVDIDFDDFNDGNAVKGYVENRKIFDLNGTDITQDVLDALTVKAGDVTQAELPTIVFTVGPGVMNDNGEIVGLLGSNYTDSTGSLKALDSGKYYALVSGAGEEQQIVGVFVVESDDPRFTGVTARETGGFILDRKVP